MLGLTPADWRKIAILLRDENESQLLDKIGMDGERGFRASTMLYRATCESLTWWEDSFATRGCDEDYTDQEIEKQYDQDTARIVKKLRKALATAR